MKDHYETLGVSRSAPLEVVEAAYRAMAKRYMPGANASQSGDVQRMKDINEAWDVISKPVTRAAFDRELNDNEAAEQQRRSGASIAPYAPPGQVGPVSRQPAPPPRKYRHLHHRGPGRSTQSARLSSRL